MEIVYHDNDFKKPPSSLPSCDKHQRHRDAPCCHRPHYTGGGENNDEGTGAVESLGTALWGHRFFERRKVDNLTLYRKDLFGSGLTDCSLLQMWLPFIELTVHFNVREVFIRNMCHTGRPASLFLLYYYVKLDHCYIIVTFFELKYYATLYKSLNSWSK